MNVAVASQESVQVEKRAGRRARLLDQAQIAIVEYGPELAIEDWNDAAERLLGYTREEALGRRVDELLPVSGDPDAWRRLLDDDDPRARVWSHARKDGGAVSIEWHHGRLLDERGEVIGVGVFGHDVTERVEHLRGLEEKAQVLGAITRTLPIVVWAVDRNATFTFHEGKAAQQAGIEKIQHIGRNAFEVYQANDDEQAEGHAVLLRALAGEPGHSLTSVHGLFWENWQIPVRDERGEVYGVVGFTLDITEAKRTEQELRTRLDLIERQQQVIRDLSTPIIQVWDGVLTLPMIGVVDSARTAQVMDSLLEAVARTRARFAILDLTGVEMVDTKTAGYLIELVRAIRLLGAEGIVAGIRSNVAQTIVALGLDLADITTLGNLRAALQHCIRQMSKERAASAPAGAPPPR
ncbi:anti-anti-sigma factor [Sorangium cellulosum]|uniref:Anti-anti-sigma factor n=1 Tax=Sorangium cellulosum TaxID=56 RepID=A0A4V0NDV1_SORCE|nr:PAS domain-containing protein [Sorangium cellulosum]AUX23952.1 anti-anti-sigma factor [Sorangium cellulosum]